MYCTNCGSKVSDDSRFCHNCGKKLSAPNDEPMQNEPANTQAKGENTLQEQNLHNLEHEKQQSFANENETSEEISQNADCNVSNEQSKQEQISNENDSSEFENSPSDTSQNSYNQQSNTDNYQNQNEFKSFETPEKQWQNHKNDNTLDIIIKIVCCIFGFIFLWYGFSNLFGSFNLISGLPFIMHYNGAFAFMPPLNIISAAVYILMTIILLLIGFQRNKKNSGGLFFGFSALFFVWFITFILRQLVHLVIYYDFSDDLNSSAIMVVVCIAAVYCLLYASKDLPDLPSFFQNLSKQASTCLNDISSAVKDFFANFKRQNQSYNQQSFNNQANNTNNFGSNSSNNNQNFQNNKNSWGYGNNMDNQNNNMNNYQPPVMPLNQDRNIIIYILLCIVTCGIYGLYTVYTISRDVNAICEGDGQQTTGLLMYFLLSIVTCGIYSFYWHYSVANRLAANAPRYGTQFQENGTTILLWMLLGSLLCGIGFYVGLYIIFKNLNTLSAAYNNRRF